VRILVAATLLASLAAPAAAAADDDGWHQMPDAGYVFTDGDRLAAWMLDAGTARVRTRGVSWDLDIAPDCAGARLLAAGGGRLLLECSGDETYRVMDIATGAAARTPDLPFTGDEVQPFDVGAEWLAVSVTDEEADSSYTGYVRLDGSEARRDDGGRDVVPDLDVPSLLQPMCEPLRRRVTGRAADGYAPYVYAPPLGLTHRGHDRSELVLERCGRRSVELAACRGLFACANPALTPSHVAWSANRGTFLHDARTGVTRRWRSPEGKRNVAVALTRHRLYVSYRTAVHGPSASFRRLGRP